MEDLQQIINSATKNKSAPKSYANGTENYVPTPPTLASNPSQINTTVPNTIPSTALQGNTSYSDLFAKRNSLDTQNQQNIAGTQQFNDILGRANAPLTGTPFTNPEAYINNLLLNRPTDTQIELDKKTATQASNTRSFSGEYSDAGTKANKDFNVAGLQDNLAQTRTSIAERTAKLRQDLRNFETNAKERGVDRSFADSAKSKLQADAAAELADLSIIENAQTGNLTQAQAEVDRVLQNKLQSFQFENTAIQQEIDRLNSIDTRESKQRAEQLSIALDTRKQNIEKAQSDQKARLDYMTQAAANGADTQTLDAIRNAQTPEEAALHAGPWIGRLDRMKVSSSLYTDSLQQKKLLAELNPTGTVNNDSIVAYGQQYAETGKIPTVSELKQSNLSISQVTEYAKQLPKQNGSILSSSTGIKSSSLSSTQEDGISALYDILQKTSQLRDLDDQRQKGLISAGVGKVFGSADQQRYIDLRTEIVDLLARARSGAALTTEEVRTYESQLPGRIGEVGVIPWTDLGLFGADTNKRIDNFESKIDGTLKTKLSTTGVVIQGYSKVNVPSLGEKTVGEIINIGETKYRVLPDGTLTDII